jgi:hypothetical protein
MKTFRLNSHSPMLRLVATILRAADDGGAPAAHAPAEGGETIDDVGIPNAESLIDGATAEGGNASDTVEGANGNDTVEAGDGNDTVDGGDGNDEVTYELTPPEGFENLDAAAIEAATPIFRELKLSSEQAQGVVNSFAKDVLPAILASAQEKQAAAFNDTIAATRAGWANEAKADKDINPNADGFKANMSMAAKGRDAFASPELREFMEVTGIGNHPAVIKMFMRIGAEISEGAFVRSDETSQEKGEAWQRAYGPEFQPKSSA